MFAMFGTAARAFKVLQNDIKSLFESEKMLKSQFAIIFIVDVALAGLCLKVNNFNND